MNIGKKRGVIETISDSKGTLKEKIGILARNIELCKKYKQETIKHARRLEEQYRKGLFSYTEYEYVLNKYLKGQPLDQWVQHYEDQEKLMQGKITDLRLQKPKSLLEKQVTHFEKKSKNSLFTYSLIILFLIAALSIPLVYQTFWHKNLITGLTIGEQSFDFITGYAPENNPEILIGESQTFTITTSAQENTTLSIQWYVDNLPVADQNSETFSYIPEALGEYEIKVLVNDLQDYSTHKWALIINESAENLTLEENITVPEEGVIIPEENITIPENVTVPEIVEEVDQLVQLPAEINKPVKWIRTITNENQATQLKIRIPKTATNVKAKKIIQLINERVEEEIPDDKIIIGSSYSITGFVTTEQPRKAYTPNLFKDVSGFLKNLFKFTGFITADVSETKEVTIDAAAPKYEISYETPAPLVEETLTENGKLVKISSNYTYENILAYTNIKETRGEVRLYWLTNDTKILHEAELIDTNDDNLTDKVQWIVEHLSEQVFEIEVNEAIDTTINETINQTQEQALEEKNFTKFIPSKEVYDVWNCPECPVHPIAMRQFCVVTNAFERGSDYGAEIVFELPANMSASYAEICAYKFRIFTGIVPDDFTAQNYIEHADAPLLENFSIDHIDANWTNITITKENGWVCADITSMIDIQNGTLRVRWWGADLERKASLPYICFIGSETNLEDCEGNNQSGADDCRPYLRIIEK